MKPSIFPEPKLCTVLSGQECECNASIDTNQSGWTDAVDTFLFACKKIHEKTLAKKEGGIELIYMPTVRPDGYVLDTENGIKLSASTKEGILYAVATLLQIVRFKDEKVFCPTLHIEDHPDKDFRGIMIDLARRFHASSTVLKYIDLCFFYKIKYLHLHLIDDESYTLPSKHYPLLPTHKKSYTAEEIKQFNDYAASRGIILIPEIEAPGHAKSLNSAYPDVFSNQMEEASTTSYSEAGAILSDNSVVCVGSESTMKAYGELIQEICELFPNSPYIHIGGDEANMDSWAHCSVCKQYMKEHGIDGVEDLYSDFTARMAQLVLDQGRTPIVWEGFSKKGAHRVPRETIVIAWESHYHQAEDLLNEGFRIINASWQPLYIVSSLQLRWHAREILDWDVYNLQHWWEESAATLNPIHLQPTDQVLGAQICSWGCTFEEEISLVIENLAALSERTWNVHKRSSNERLLKDFEPFTRKASCLIAN